MSKQNLRAFFKFVWAPEQSVPYPQVLDYF